MHLRFGVFFHLEELENLAAVGGVVLVLAANVEVQLNGLLEVADAGGLVELQRLGQLVEMCFEPVAHFFDFLVCKMFFVFHERKEAGMGSEKNDKPRRGCRMIGLVRAKVVLFGLNSYRNPAFCPWKR